MTDYNVTVGKELVPEILSSQDGLSKLIESVLNQVLEAQVSDSLGAERYERSDERLSYHNGYRTATLYIVLITLNFRSLWLMRCLLKVVIMSV